MAAQQSVLAAFEEDLTAQFKQAHVEAHIKQFAALFAAGFVVALAGAGWHISGWDALLGLLLAGVGAAARQLWPQLPWPVALDTVHAAQQEPTPTPIAPPHG